MERSHAMLRVAYRCLLDDVENKEENGEAADEINGVVIPRLRVENELISPSDR